jgi:tetraacyldisaccharide 4'-kinase
MFKTPKFWQNRNLLSILLLPISWLYISLGYLRSLFAETYAAKAKVICIGNNIVGGSGKTGIVIKLCQLMQEKSLKFCVVTFGPGGKLIGPKLINASLPPEIAGDEALMLCEIAPTIIAKNKAQGVKLGDLMGFEYIIVDDGIQNPYFKKDITICVHNPGIKNNGYIFPAGPNRESLNTTIEKSNILISFGTQYNYQDKICLAAEKLFQPKFHKEEIIAFCSIANPDLFKEALLHNQAQIKAFHIFPDHFIYQDCDLNFINTANNQYKIVTTQKDYVKLPHKFQKSVIVLEENIQIAQEERLLNEIIKQKN